MYEIIIGKAIGDIRIGMKREEVQNLLNDLEEWRETPFGYDHEVVYDNNDEFQICYDDDDEDEVARIESVQVAVKNYW